jgi:hypothetical protein
MKRKDRLLDAIFGPKRKASPKKYKRGEDLKFYWEWCEECGPHVVCPVCNNNLCNGMSGEVNGKKCVFCALGYQYQDAVKTRPTKRQIKGAGWRLLIAKY